MVKVKTKIWAHMTKKYLQEKGENLGLSGKSLEFFKHFNEVELVIEVQDDGMVISVKAVEI